MDYPSSSAVNIRRAKLEDEFAVSMEERMRRETENELHAAVKPPRPKVPKTRARTVIPDPPNSTLSDKDSLRELRRKFNISEEIELLLPSPSERAWDPPPGCFTMYESSFNWCLYFFPIPEVILEFLWMYQIALAQVNPRGLRHLMGIFVRSIECDEELSVFHLLNWLDVRASRPTEKLVYSVSAKANRSIIGGFPSKDRCWINYFFYVPISEASVGSRWVDRIVREWRRKVINPWPKVPQDFLTLAELLASERCDWLEDFSLQRIEDARTRYLCGSVSSNNLSHEVMEMKRPSVRERMEAAKRHLASQSEGGVQNMEIDAVASSYPRRHSTSSADNRSRAPSEYGIQNAADNDVNEVTKPAGVTKKGNLRLRKRTMSAAEKGKGAVSYTFNASQGDLTTPEIAEQEAPLAPIEDASDKGRLSLDGTKLVDSITKQVRKWDRRIRREVESANQAAVEARAKWEAEVKQREALEKIHNDMRDSSTQKDSEIESLRGQLISEKSSVESKVKSATKKIVGSLMKKFKSKIERTKEKFKALGKSVEKMNDLAQIDANLELLNKLQGDNAPTLQDEAADVLGWRHQFVGGDVEYNALYNDIRRGLVVSPYGDALNFDVQPFEDQAAEVGVHWPSGSNWGPTGLCLLDTHDAPDGTEAFGVDGGEGDELDGTEGYGVGAEGDGNEVDEDEHDGGN